MILIVYAILRIFDVLKKMTHNRVQGKDLRHSSLTERMGGIPRSVLRTHPEGIGSLP